MRLVRLLSFVKPAALLLAGGVIGALIAGFAMTNAEVFLESTIWLGIVVGIGLCFLAFMAYWLVRPRNTDAPASPSSTDLQSAKDALVKATQSLGLENAQAEQLVDTAKTQGRILLALGIRLWTGAASLGLALAVAGSVIAMVTAFAAIRQVSRIDAQNALFETQIFEAQATRAASVFTAQLPSLLAAIDAERKTATAKALDEYMAPAFADAFNRYVSETLETYSLTATPEETERLRRVFYAQNWDRLPDTIKDELPKDVFSHGSNFLSASDLRELTEEFEDRTFLWVPSAALRARIQSVIDTSEPFLRLPDVDQAVAALNAEAEARNATIQGDLTDAEFRLRRGELGWMEPLPQMRFSPQRGQLLRLLLAAKIDFNRVEPPFDFSHSDLNGFSAEQQSNPQDASGFERARLGRTILAHSSFLGGILDQVNIARVDLRGSFVERAQQMQFAITQLDPFEFQSDRRLTDDPDFLFGTSFEDVVVLNEPFAKELEREGGLGNQYVPDGGGPVHIMEARELELGLEGKAFQIAGFISGDLLGMHPVALRADAGENGAYRLGRHDMLSTIWIHTQQALNGGLANRNNAPRQRGDCAGMQPFALNLMRDVVWYAQQPGTHPKWDTAVDLVIEKVHAEDQICFTEWGGGARQPPALDQAALFEGLK